MPQNYNLFTSQQKYLYGDPLNYYSVEFVSIEPENQDTTLRVYLYEDYVNSYTYKYFPGHKIVKYSDGKYLLFNKNMDTIVIHSTAALNSSWKLYKYSDGSFLQATVGEPTKEMVLTTEDSIKNIIVEHYGADGIKTSAVYPSIKISKTKGLVQAHLFYTLPSISNAILLVGLENPEEGLTNLNSKKAFNYEVGDEFHYLFKHESRSDREDDSVRWTIVKIIDKVENPDNYQYTVEQWSKETCIRTNYYQYSTTTSYSHTTENLVYSFNGSMPYTAINIPLLVPSLHFYYATMKQDASFNNRMVKTINKENLSRTITKYSAGLGLIFHSTPKPDPFYPISRIKELVYYKKGSETWGTPFNETDLTTSVNEPSSDEKLIYYSNNCLIYNSPQALSIDLYTSQGQLIRSFSDIKGSGKLSLTDLPSAIYLYVLNSGEKTSKGHFSLTR